MRYLRFHPLDFLLWHFSNPARINYTQWVVR